MCGVVGVIQVPHKTNPDSGEQKTFSDKASLLAYQALLMLQHRGQDGAGIVSYNDDDGRFVDKKKLGLVAQVFDKDDFERLKGRMALAHTRYATVGGDGTRDLQPMLTGVPFGVAMAHNGNLANYYELARESETKYKIKFFSNSDLEVLLQLFCYFLASESVGRDTQDDFHFETGLKAMQKLANVANGSYSLAGLIAGVGLFALRDPNGIRPLVLGKREDAEGVTYMLASETSALQFLGMEIVRDVLPGEFILITKNGEVKSAIIHNESIKHLNSKDAAHCMFEWVYFAGAESVIEGQSVYSTRLELGRKLAAQVRLRKTAEEFDVVMPVPDTGRSAALALAEELKIPYREGLIKNRYVQRSFILSGQSKREVAVQLKLIPILSEIKGKKILLVDDSIVRGTTSKKIVGLLKSLGAQSVSLAVTCPPIKFPCYYGVDFPKKGDLLLSGLDSDEAAAWIGADQLFFTSKEDLQSAIAEKKLCTGCLSGTYPTNVNDGQNFASMREKARKENV